MNGPYSIYQVRIHWRRGAFSLVEVLVSVSIIALLLAVLLPSVNRARQQARAVVCLSNLRQMGLAASAYNTAYRGRYPPYLWNSPDGSTSYAWDLTTSSSWTTGILRVSVRPGTLWQGTSNAQIQQCPVYRGSDNWIEYPYTGYNYNTSYVGYCVYRVELDKSFQPTGRIIAEVNPVRMEEIRRPALCALFGDGQYAEGANKFMRAPRKGRDTGFSGRSAGTQGFRHLDRTNVIFADGHAASWIHRYSDTYAFDQDNIAPGTGFLSKDNSLYDLE